MNIQNFDEECKRIEKYDKSLYASYIKSGFLKDEQDATQLHRALNPYRIKRGMTKLQIRRKINNFIKNGEKFDYNINSVEVRINGKIMIHGSFIGKVPDTKRKIINFLNRIF